MTYTPQQIRDYIIQNGLENDPAGIYAAAKRYDVSPAEVETAMGWQPGSAQRWIDERGLTQPNTGTSTQGTVSFADSVDPVVAARSQQTQVPAAQQASNQFIGMTTPGVSTSSNPYIGLTSGTVRARQANVVRNQLAGVDNPYLGRAIDAASQDAIRNYSMTVAPQRQTQMQQSGAFGNTGVQQMQLEDQRNLQNTLGNIATNARLKDYMQQLMLAENAAARGTQANQFNSSQDLAAQQFNVGARQADIARNLGAMSNIGMFNANLAQRDLERNTNAALGLGTFNAGAANQMSMFGANLGQQNNQYNASALNDASRFNSQQAQQRNLYNAGAANTGSMFDRNLAQQGSQFDRSLAQSGSQFDRSLAQSGSQFDRSLAQSGSQFDKSLAQSGSQFDRSLAQSGSQFDRSLAQSGSQFDRSLAQNNQQFSDRLDLDIYGVNANAANNAISNQINLYRTLYGMQGSGYDLANNIYMQPMNVYGGFANAANAIGGQGGVTSQTATGDPITGAIGGWQIGSAMFPQQNTADYTGTSNPYSNPYFASIFGR